MVNRLRLLFLPIILIISQSNILSIEFEYENTWTRYTIYKKGIEIFENKLYVNTYCAIESYNILANGSIELHQDLEVNGLIRDIQFDESDNMLYVHISDYLENGFDRIYAYNNIENDLIFNFSTEEVDKFTLHKDLIYTVSNYVILGQPNLFPCYNKQTQQLVEITYPYQEIIGSFNNIIVEYNQENTMLNFYEIEEINNPDLIYQYSYEMISDNRSYIRNFSSSHCLLIDREQILVFYIDDEQNINYQTLWDIELTYDTDKLFEPIQIQENQIYIGTSGGENFVFDISDYETPVLLYNWIEEDSEVNGYCVYNNSFLYRSENFFGIWKYNLDELPSTQYEEYGDAFPFRSTAYIDGLIYKNDNYLLYSVNPDTYEEEIICEIPFYTGMDYYKINNLLIIFVDYGFILENYCAIIDLDTNQLLNYITLNGPILIVQNEKIFIQNGDIVNVYCISNSYELDYLTNFSAESLNFITEFDNEHLWVDYFYGDFLYNSASLEIDYDFSDFFSPDPQRHAKPLKYDDRMIITDMQYEYDAEIRLYDINSLDNPILLDFKTENYNFNYFQLNDYILECFFLEPVKIYDKFEDSFTESIQEHDFETAIFTLVIDEERNRIASSSSFYNFRTFNYELTESGIKLVPEINIHLSNYPNPFNPKTTITFKVPVPGKVQLNIYNIKGQKINQLMNDYIERGYHGLVWDGTDANNNPVESGIYLYQLKMNEQIVDSRKCILLK